MCLPGCRPVRGARLRRHFGPRIQWTASSGNVYALGARYKWSVRDGEVDQLLLDGEQI
jgi:hypothetical protein